METAEIPAQELPSTAPAPPKNGRPTRVDPDLDFIRMLTKQGGDTLHKCFQCGTCSATCAVSPDTRPFPRKEMAWAVWGLKDRLLKDPDVWLCYQCNDCSTRCPRGAKPGDVLAAVRQETVRQHSFPRFLGRWVNEPQSFPFMLGIPTALLALAVIFKDEIGEALGFSLRMDHEIVYSYSSMFPHWLLNTLFLSITVLVMLAVIIGIARFWRSLKSGETATPVKGLFPSIVDAVKSVFLHTKFTACTSERTRLISHMAVFFGFLALCMVTFWIITSGINPIIKRDFIYPFSFWSPWKLLANIGGAALAFGCFVMMRDRLRQGKLVGVGTYFDWAFLSLLFAVVLTGFFTEILHYIRLEPHRHVIYFVHLVCACTLIMYLPYSKFAHLIYRTTAMVYAEYTGRYDDTGGSAAEEIANRQGEE